MMRIEHTAMYVNSLEATHDWGRSIFEKSCKKDKIRELGKYL